MNKRKVLIGIITIGCVLSGATYFFIKFIPHRDKAIEKKQESVLIESKKTQNNELSKTKKETAKITPDTNTAIEALINKLTDEDLKIAQEAADKLVNMKEKAIPALITALKEASVGLKGQIVFILGRICSKKATPDLTEVLRNDENAYVRSNTAVALGKIRDEKSLSALTFSLFDKDTSVRQNSAWALGRLKDSQAAGSLLQSLNEEKEMGVRSAVVDSLGALRDRSATEALLVELKAQNDLSYKNEVVMALGEIADPKALDGLTEYLSVLKQYRPPDGLKWYYQESIRKVEAAIEKIKVNPR
jgi:HEAT repeat protein